LLPRVTPKVVWHRRRPRNLEIPFFLGVMVSKMKDNYFVEQKILRISERDILKLRHVPHVFMGWKWMSCFNLSTSTYFFLSSHSTHCPLSLPHLQINSTGLFLLKMRWKCAFFSSPKYKLCHRKIMRVKNNHLIPM
jgi:hypothetical protein